MTRQCKKNIVNEILARHNYAVNALKLQLYGITEQQILNFCRAIEANGHNLNLQPINSQVNFGLSRNQGERLDGKSSSQL